MAWEGDRRTSTTAWRKLRAQVLRRDRHICHVCRRPGADQVDHLVPTAEGGTDHPSNLAAIHDDPCHRAKSSAEGNRAKARQRASAKRTPERHPGLI